LAILAAIAIPALTGYIDKAKVQDTRAKARELGIALQTLLSEAYADPQTSLTYTNATQGRLYVGGQYFASTSKRSDGSMLLNMDDADAKGPELLKKLTDVSVVELGGTSGLDNLSMYSDFKLRTFSWLDFSSSSYELKNNKLVDGSFKFYCCAYNLKLKSSGTNIYLDGLEENGYIVYLFSTNKYGDTTYDPV
jgi:type II secretory pathway pseudopilin PulG